MKKIVAILFAIMSVSALADTWTDPNTGITWTYTVSNSEASVGGEYSWQSAVPKTTKGAITIPSTLGGYPVTSIRSWAFEGCSGLTSVTIPSSVTSIGSSAFKNCSALTSVTIPSSVTSIGGSAFEYCSGLTSITIPNSVTSIGSSAFYGCSGLKEFIVDERNTAYKSANGLLLTKDGTELIAGLNGAVTIPSSVTRIGNYAFYRCSSLTSVTIPSSVTSIGDFAFEDCSALASITIPESVTSIGNWAFFRCSALTSVTIPESVTSIGSDAFMDCSSLTSVTILEGVTRIGYYMFCGCSALTSVTIPSSVTSIGEAAFKSCSSLASVTILEGVTSIDYQAFKGCSALTSVTIPESVTSIGSEAFYGCSGLTSVTIPSSVTSIGEAAFYGCSALTGINVDSANMYYCSIDGVLYNKGATELICCPGGAKAVTIPSSVKSIGWAAFEGCSSLTSVMIPSSVTSIGSWAFGGCSSLTSVTIQEGVTSIGERVFVGCSSLTSVTIPSSVTSIGREAFCGCSALTSVTIPSSVTSIGSYAFDGCTRLKTVCVSSGDADRVKSLMIGKGVDVNTLEFVEFKPDGGPYTQVVDGIEWTYMVSNGEASVGGGTRSSPAIPTTTKGAITIPSTLGGCPVTSIGDIAFAGCSALTSVTIPSSVKSIGWGAFEGCCSLTSVTIPSSVMSIGEWAFLYCSTLTSINVDSENRNYCSIDGVLYNKDATELICCPNGARTVTIPLSVTSIGYQAFRGCSLLTSVTIPVSVVEVGERAFGGCESLTNLTFDGNAPRCADNAFSDMASDVVLHVSPSSSGWMQWNGMNVVYDEGGQGGAVDRKVEVSMTVTNVVVHYVLNGIVPEAVTPTIDNALVAIYTEVKGDAVAIPQSWAEQFPQFEEKFGTDFVKALTMETGKKGAGGAPMLVWHDFVAGTDPTNPEDTFKASITFDKETGKPIISWTPEVKDESGKYLRKYTVYGKAKLTDEQWEVVPEGREDDYNFFKVTVEML